MANSYNEIRLSCRIVGQFDTDPHNISSHYRFVNVHRERGHAKQFIRVSGDHVLVRQFFYHFAEYEGLQNKRYVSPFFGRPLHK